MRRRRAMETTVTTPGGPDTRKQAMGRYGEELAARHLSGLGMALLDRNWRFREGEIDLVLRDCDALVVCEAKTRTDDSHGSLHEAVTPAKLERLLRLGERWADAHGVRPPETRVDLVSVLQPHSGRSVLNHVRGLACYPSPPRSPFRSTGRSAIS